MKDFAGNELKIGDRVVTTSSTRKELIIRYIYGFTDKRVKLVRTMDDVNFYMCRANHVIKTFNQ